MRILNKEESKEYAPSLLIEKQWKKFLPKAVHNLGYSDELIKNMYPYHGYLRINGEKVTPILNGRYFLMPSIEDIVNLILIEYMKCISWTDNNLKTAITKISNKIVQNTKILTILKEKYKLKTEAAIQRRVLDECLRNKKIIMETNGSTSLITDIGTSYYGSDYTRCVFVQNTTLDKIDKSILTKIDIIQLTKDIINTTNAVYETLHKDVWILSLNPVDKFMASTNQPFGSCISMFKEGQNSGSSSCLPGNICSLFANESVFTFLITDKKLNNMYWDRTQKKPYKHYKMSTRAFSYMTTAHLKDQKEELENKKEKLLIGRQYGRSIAYLNPSVFLHKAGIQTRITDLLKEKAPTQTSTEHLCKGLLINKYVTVLDRFGYRRNTYFDNIHFEFYRKNVQKDALGNIHPTEIAKTTVHTDNYSSTCGSASLQQSSLSGLNILEIITGKQAYTYYNRYVDICKHCREAITKDTKSKYNGICTSCEKKQGYKTCASCGVTYTNKNAKDHEILNINKLIYPKDYKTRPSNCLCLTQALRQFPHESRTGSQQYAIGVCQDCNKQVILSNAVQKTVLYSNDKKQITIKKGLCDSCLSSYVLCDHCKTLIKLDSVSKSVALLPNKKIICRECLDQLPKTQKHHKELADKLNKLTGQLLQSLNAEEKEIIKSKLNKELTKAHITLNEEASAHDIRYITRHLTKNIYKQLASIKTGVTLEEHKPVKKNTNANLTMEQLSTDMLEELIEEFETTGTRKKATKHITPRTEKTSATTTSSLSLDEVTERLQVYENHTPVVVYSTPYVGLYRPRSTTSTEIVDETLTWENVQSTEVQERQEA